MFLSSWKRRKASKTRSSKKHRAAAHRRGPAPLRLSFESLDRRIMLSVTALDSNFGAVETLPYGNSGAITNQATANAEVIQPDGKIIVAGSAGYGGTAYMLARYNTNGTLDTSFGNNGLVTIQPDIQDSFVSVALEANGDIVAGGDQAVLRFSPDGTLLTTQALPFYVSAVAVEPDGSIVAAGFDNSPSSPGDALARLGSNGFLDTSFGTNGIVIHNGGAIVGIVTEADGSIVLGENLDLYGFRIEDYSEDGTLVAANEFNVGGVDSFSKLYSITKQPDGMIVAVGDVTPQDGSQEAYIARVSRFGVLDPTFGVMLTASSSIENAQAVAVQADGQIVIAGTSDAYSGQNTNTIEIQTFNPNGSFAGIATFPAPDQISLTGLALDPDGDVILAATPTSTVGPFYPTAIELVGFSDPPTALGFPDASILAGGPDLDINLASGFSNPTYSPLTYAIVADSNSSLFSSATIDQTTGTLSLSATSFTGQAELTISATNPAGQDVETTLDVTVYNNAPTFTKGADVTVSENSGSQDVASWATNMTAGPGNPKPTFRFSVTGDTDSSLFAAGPAIDGQGNLTFTPAPGASGSATISILMSDGGGTAGGRIDTTPAAQTFTITLTPIVNQPPVFSIGPNETVSDTAGAQVYSNWATGISAGAGGEANQILTFDVTTTYGANLFAVQPTILPNGTLRFSPAVGANGTAVVSVVLTDNGGTANGGQDTSVTQSFDITIQDNTNSLSALPALSSLPGAPATLYLNFGGDTVNSWGNETPGVIPAYDQDGDPTTFSDAELAAIKEIWTQVANAYSPFNINVTTVKPASMAHGQTMEVDIGGTGAWDSSQPEGGVAFVGGFTNASLPNLAFVFSVNQDDGDPTGTADAIEHEAGHMLGLEHQSTYSGTTLVDEYNPGTAAAGPIMGVPYNSATARWWDGPSDVSSTTIQDDMAVIADATNGFGYRPDVWNNTMATAATLTNAGGLLTASAVIEQPTDTDYYTLQSPGGAFGDFTILPASFGSTLDFTAELVSSSGQVLSTIQGNLQSVELNASLPKGTDYLVIKGLGDYGDVGQYSISGSISAGPAILGAPNLTVQPGAPQTVINLNTVFRDPVGWTSTPSFTVSTSNPAIFDGTPVIDPQNDTLTMAYASASGVTGSSTVTLTTTDDGVSATTSFTVTLQPLVSVSGPVVTINGASGADTMAIDFTSASDFSITVDGATSSYSTQNINQIIVLGQGGADTLTVSDTYNTGVGTWNPQFMQWNTAMYQISAVNTQDIAFTGNQNDSATLNGTTGSDQATLTATSVEMLNTGLFDNQVTAFGSAQVVAGSSSATAAIQDSGGGAVVGSAAQTSLSGSGYSYVAKGFQHVTATAGSGSDTVQLNASPGYTVATTASSSVLTGPGGAQAIVATGFSSQQQQQPPTAVVQSGPVLTVTGTSGADTMAISFSSAAAFSITVNGTTSSYSTQNINQIIVHGLGGTDTLTVSDTFNTGVGTWNPQLMQWNSTKYQISADKTQDIVFTGKQSDSATLNGSTGSDQATLTSTSVEMSNTALFDNKITGFGTAQVVAGSSAATAAVQDSGGGAVVGSAAQTSLSGTGYSYLAKGFQHVTATAGSNSDTVQLNPSAGYTVATTASSSVLTGPGGAQVIVATGFSSQTQQQQPPTAVVQSGPVLTVTGTNGADTMAISFSSAAAFSITVNGTTSSYSTQNINQIIVHGLGGTDTLTVSDTYNTGVGTWNPQLMQWNSTKYQISADKTQDIVFTGKQSDSATLNGSTGSDQATLTSTSVEMSNTALFDNKITGFGTAQVVAGSSAATAAVQDSGGGAVVGSAAQTSLSGTGYSYLAKGFQHVTATAGSSSDTVQLNPSAGYTVSTTASSSVLTGPGGAQVIVATGFSSQTQQTPPTAVVQSGPVLTVTGTNGADTMAISFSSAAAFSITVNGTTSSYFTQNINQIIVHGLGGADTLTVSDPFNTGVGTWSPQFMQWNTAMYQISADKTQDIAFTGKETDSATLNGTTGSDQATLNTTSVEIANTGLFDNKVTGFGTAQVVAGSSSTTAAIQDSGGGAVVGSATQTSLSGTGYSYVAKGFQRVTATAGSGSDTVQLNASPGYTVATTASSSVLTGPGGAQVIVATGFSSQTQQQQPPTVVVQSGPVLTVTGTSGADTMAITFSSAAAFSITVNGTTSSYSTQNINQIIVHGLGGLDSLVVSDDFNTGVGTWSPQFMQWNTAKYQISADKTQIIHFNGEQNDSATLNGSTGSDQAELATTFVDMSNTALFDNNISGFGTAQVVAGSSAATAAIQDSGGGAVVGSATQTSLTGTGYSYVAKGFQHLTATAGSGADTVQLNASSGYTVATTANSTVLTGPGGAQVIVATGFSSQTQQQQPPTAVVQSGPVLTVTGTSGADTMAITFSSATAFSITVNGTTSSYSTQNINQIIVHGLGGADTLTVSDTFNTGVGTWSPQFMQWNTAKYQISADKTQDIAFTGNQNDSATFNGTTGSDQATLTTTSVEMANTALFDNKVTGFGTAQVVAGSASATASIQDSGGGAVVGTPTQTSLSGTGYSYVAAGFQGVTATAGSSADTVELDYSASFPTATQAGEVMLTNSTGAVIITAIGFSNPQLVNTQNTGGSSGGGVLIVSAPNPPIITTGGGGTTLIGGGTTLIGGGTTIGGGTPLASMPITGATLTLEPSQITFGPVLTSTVVAQPGTSTVLTVH